MSIVNKLLRNFSEGKSRIPVVASAVAIGVALALTTCGTPAPAFDGTYKLTNSKKTGTMLLIKQYHIKMMF